MESPAKDFVANPSSEWEGNTTLLFTVIFEFEGLTSVAQVVAEDADAAFRKWTQGLTRPQDYGLESQQAMLIGKTIERHNERRKLTPLGGTQSVWCTTETIGKELALFNIIATLPEALDASESGAKKAWKDGQRKG